MPREVKLVTQVLWPRGHHMAMPHADRSPGMPCGVGLRVSRVRGAGVGGRGPSVSLRSTPEAGSLRTPPHVSRTLDFGREASPPEACPLQPITPSGAKSPRALGPAAGEGEGLERGAPPGEAGLGLDSRVRACPPSTVGAEAGHPTSSASSPVAQPVSQNVSCGE